MNENQLIEMFGKMMNEQFVVLDRKLDEKLRPIHKEISEIKGDISGMKSDFTAMQGDIRGMKSDINFIRVHVVSLDNHMDQMISKFIPELKNGIFEIRQENRALSHICGELNLEIEKLKL